MNNKLQALKEKVFEANQNLVKHGLVIHTWGNASGIDRESGTVVIKPSGVDYSIMTMEDMVIVDLESGDVINSNLRPSSDLLTHLELYKAFPEIGGVVHVHSTYAVAWAQAECEIPCFGTTHADYFYGAIPVTRGLTVSEIEDSYEKNTGHVIVDLFRDRHLSEKEVPGVLVAKHGPFTWGGDVLEAERNALFLEEIAKMGHLSQQLNPTLNSLPSHILTKHYSRKHGADAYYGQHNYR